VDSTSRGEFPALDIYIAEERMHPALQPRSAGKENEDTKAAEYRISLQHPIIKPSMLVQETASVV
jgi:hypothetical protein